MVRAQIRRVAQIHARTVRFPRVFGRVGAHSRPLRGRGAASASTLPPRGRGSVGADALPLSALLAYGAATRPSGRVGWRIYVSPWEGRGGWRLYVPSGDGRCGFASTNPPQRAWSVGASTYHPGSYIPSTAGIVLFILRPSKRLKTPENPPLFRNREISRNCRYF